MKKYVGVLMLVLLVLVGKIDKCYSDYTYTQIDYPGASKTAANGINDEGIIVGNYLTGSSGYGFILINEEFTQIVFPGSVHTEVHGVNNYNHYVGYYKMSGSGPRHGFIMDGNGFNPFDFSGAPQTAVTGINDEGDIVGFYIDSSGKMNGFLQEKGGPLETINYSSNSTTYETIARDINNEGKVVGRYFDGTKWHGFSYQDGVFSPYDKPGSLETFVQGINNFSQFVGWFYDIDENQRAFLFDGTESSTLDTLIGVAQDINNSGVMVGYSNINYHAYVVTPFQKAIEQILMEVKAAIDEPSVEFKNNPDQRKNALFNKIDAIIESLAVADLETDPVVQDELYDEAISKLQNDLRAKLDSCLGGNDKNDWIKDCDTQVLLNDQIDEITAMIIDLKNNN